MILSKKNKSGNISYRVKVYVNGRQVAKTFTRKRDAELWKQKMVVDRERGYLKLEAQKNSSPTFLEFQEQWFNTKSIELAPRSQENYRSILDIHLNPFLKETKIGNISMLDGHKLISLLKSKGKNPKGINMVIILLKGILNDAVKWEILSINPLRNLSALKVPPRSVKFWMPEDIQKFLLANRFGELYELWVVALNTGMRKGELAGLCWDKVDFKNKLIHVCRSRDRTGLRDATKTCSSFRYIPMNKSCEDAFRSLYEQKRHSSLVFAYRSGGPVDFQHVREREFRQAILKANVPLIRFHDMRGTFAANVCMAPGGDLYALSKILGHSNVDMTAKRYAHLHNDFLKKVASSVNFS